MIAHIFNPEKGTWVLLSFITFFAIIVAVNAVFISTALRTHSGVVTKQPYEKGLAYNEILESALNQPNLQQHPVFEKGVLRWEINDETGQPLSANVTGRLVRPVKGGQDFEVVLSQVQIGVYEARVELPMKGRWDALLKAEWNNKQYKTRFSFIAN